MLVWIICGRLTPAGIVFQQHSESEWERRVKLNRGKVERWPFASSTESSILRSLSKPGLSLSRFQPTFLTEMECFAVLRQSGFMPLWLEWQSNCNYGMCFPSNDHNTCDTVLKNSLENLLDCSWVNKSLSFSPVRRCWSTLRGFTANGCSARSEQCSPDASCFRTQRWRSSWPTEVKLSYVFQNNDHSNYLEL